MLQRSHLAFVELGKGNGVQLVLGHVQTSSNTCVPASTAQVGYGFLGHRHLQEIDVAPGPAFAGLE